MKPLFLDIDGTLNCIKIGSPDFEPACVRAFNRIVTATGAVIVLSSSWRYKVHQGHLSLAGMAEVLRQNGVCGELIGVTRPDADVEDEPRWRQIADWLRDPPAAIERYCILDDDLDAFGGRPGVLTNRWTGLTEADADAAIAILNP